MKMTYKLLLASAVLATIASHPVHATNWDGRYFTLTNQSGRDQIHVLVNEGRPFFSNETKKVEYTYAHKFDYPLVVNAPPKEGARWFGAVWADANDTPYYGKIQELIIDGTTYVVGGVDYDAHFIFDGSTVKIKR